MLCRRLPSLAQPHGRRLASMRAKPNFALDFFVYNPGWLRALTRTLLHPRLGPSGASTSPESGFAVSTHVNSLSREKRKMSLFFSPHVYILWCYCTLHFASAALSFLILFIFAFHRTFHTFYFFIVADFSQLRSAERYSVSNRHTGSAQCPIG